MSFPSSLHFHGDLRVASYDRAQGLVMKRTHDARFSICFGLFFSVGLIVVGVWLFWGKVVVHYRADDATWLDAAFFLLGLVCVAFGSLVSLPLAGRLLPRRLITRHTPPGLALQGVRTRIWEPRDIRALRIHGRRYTRRTDPETVTSRYICSLVLVASSGWETLLMQTNPQPDNDVAYADLYPVARYLANLLGAPLEYRDNWDAEKPIEAPDPRRE